MNRVVNKFVLAHDRYLELDRIRTECTSPAQRESIHIALMTAYLDIVNNAKKYVYIEDQYMVNLAVAKALNAKILTYSGNVVPDQRLLLQLSLRTLGGTSVGYTLNSAQ